MYAGVLDAVALDELLTEDAAGEGVRQARFERYQLPEITCILSCAKQSALSRQSNTLETNSCSFRGTYH